MKFCIYSDRCLGNLRSTFNIFRYVSCLLFDDQNGAWPVLSSQHSTPTLHTSTISSYQLPMTIYGDTQSRVPQKVVLLLLSYNKKYVLPVQIDQPKSASLTTLFTSTIFQGFRSRWMTPFQCRCIKALMVCLTQQAVSLQLKNLFSRRTSNKEHQPISRIRYKFRFYLQNLYSYRQFSCFRQNWIFISAISLQTSLGVTFYRLICFAA